MKILIIDNYDSFTYNLVNLVRKVSGFNPDVKRNDKILIQEVKQYDKIILSPGPGIPSEAGDLLEIIREYSPSKSILGICLGLQAIGEVFGARLQNLNIVYHGISTEINICKSDSLFKDFSETFNAGRYHSWVIDPTTIPECLDIIADDNIGTIMGISHIHYDVKGLQFHPESILTPRGEHIINNWINS